MLKWFADRLAQTGRKAKDDERGFTLIELLVVVIIIGILAAIAIPTFLAQRENAQNASVVTDLRNAATAAESYAAGEGGDYSGLNSGELESNGATLSEDNSWGFVSGDADSFEIRVQGINGVGSYVSDRDPQLREP